MFLLQAKAKQNHSPYDKKTTFYSVHSPHWWSTVSSGSIPGQITQGGDKRLTADNTKVYWQLQNQLWRRDMYHEGETLVISHEIADIQISITSYWVFLSLLTTLQACFMGIHKRNRKKRNDSHNGVCCSPNVLTLLEKGICWKWRSFWTTWQ